MRVSSNQTPLFITSVQRYFEFPLTKRKSIRKKKVFRGVSADYSRTRTSAISASMTNSPLLCVSGASAAARVFDVEGQGGAFGCSGRSRDRRGQSVME